MTLTPDLVRLLQEVADAESTLEVDLIAAHARDLIATLPPHQREAAAEIFQETVAERREREA